MIKIIFQIVLFLSFFTPLLQAQDLKIHIKSGSDRLGSSYVFVNSRFAAVADSTGVASLSKKDLHLGDTLKIRFLGFTEGQVIFDKNISELGQIDVMLNTTMNIDDVVVEGDFFKFYKKVVNQNQYISDMCEFKFNFSALYTNGSDTLKYTTGDANLISNWHMRRFKYYRFKTSGDEIPNLKEMVHKARIMIISPAQSILKVKSIERTHKSRDSIFRIKYVGVEDDCNVFVSSGKFFEGSYQITTYFDRRSRMVRRIDSNYMRIKEDGERIFESSSTTYGSAPFATITIIDGVFRVESSDASKGRIEIKFWNVDNTQFKKRNSLTMDDMVDIFPKVLPYFESLQSK